MFKYFKEFYNKIILAKQQYIVVRQRYKDIVERNRKELVRGSVLDPMNHPSYDNKN